MISVMSEREVGMNSTSADAADRSFLDARVSSSSSIHHESPGPEANGSRFENVDEMDDLSGDTTSGGVAMEMEGARAPEFESRGENLSPSCAEAEIFGAASEVARLSRRPGHDWMNGFKIGDMVWGKVKSHPWWPGHIFNEAFAFPSVRRTKHDGHVLVAFFGDSSYGWFDPAELIPYEPNFPEKSRQTTARSFVKAVEESADEAGRRGGLALACRCRNPQNFRPTPFPGYVAVDVPGYEPGGIYSLDQIEKARDRFVPPELLGFVRQLAVASPRGSEGRGVSWIQSMAMLLAYRRAVFEEFDETYAQAFGVQPVWPSQDDKNALQQQEMFAPRATPLSGQLVIAEALGSQKPGEQKGATPKQTPATSKVAKVPSAKKNKYVLKRRDESPATSQPRPALPDLHQPHRPSSNYYMLPKREIKPDEEKVNILSSPRAFGAASHAGQRPSENWGIKTEPGPLDASTPTGMMRLEGNAEPSQMAVDMDSKDRFGMNIQGALDGVVPNQELLASTGEPSSMVLGKALEVKSADGVLKKSKLPKRSREDNIPDNDTADVKKKKKKMKELGLEPSQDHVPKISKDGQPLKKSVAKPSDVGSDQAERLHSDLQRRDSNWVGQTSGSPIVAALLPAVNLATLNLQLPELLDDLSSLALNPFFGIERNAPSIILQVFLKFRSLVYQKSLVLPPASEPETAELRAKKLASGKSLQGPHVASEPREPSSSSKPFKRPLKPDDPSVVGRKRGPSDGQEEFSAKRTKKLEKIKALAEKKARVALKTSEGQQREQKETSATPITKLNKAEQIKKPEAAPPKVPSPTWVVMKFPPRTTLPSVASLKARFARFGPLDLEGTRVYWKSHSCKVLFKYRVDAMSAYNYVKSNDLFGQIKVNYSIREVEAPAQEPSDAQKLQPESRLNEGVQFRPGNGNATNNSTSQPRSSLYQQPPQPSVQLKSILKKPADELGNSVGGVAKESPRVKFMLAGDGRKQPPPPPVVITDSNNNGGSGSSTDGGSFSSPFLDSPISKIPKSVSFPPPPPPQTLLPPPMNPCRPLDVQRLPPPPPLPRALDGNQIRGRLAQFAENQPSPGCDQNVGRGRNGVDVSRQMLSLLIRCNDIVMNVKSSLGYVPYHPL